MENTVNNIKSYNKFLYDKRKEAGFSRSKMARELKIFYVLYIMIESGYIKPTKKMVEKISNYFDIDYNVYLEGEASYPEELPEKPQGKVSTFIFNIMGKLWFRLTLLILALISVCFWIINKVDNDKSESNPSVYYSKESCQLIEDIKTKGSFTFSLSDDLISPEITRFLTISDSEELLFEIGTNYNNRMDLKISITYWAKNYRFSLRLEDFVDGELSYLVDFTSYTDDYITMSDSMTFNQMKNKDDKYTPYSALLSVKEKINFDKQFDILVQEKLGYTNSFTNDVLPKYISDYTAYNDYVLKTSVLEAIFLFLAAFLIFFTLYSFEYGNANNIQRVFSHSDTLLFLDNASNIKKKDMRFMPFIPEKVFQIFAIIIIGIGVNRLSLLGTLASDFSQDALLLSSRFLSIQMIGIFILCFVKFDVFLDDNRVLRNVSLYPLVFFLLYYVETYILVSLKSSSSLISNLLNVAFPNPFMSTSCYFLIMFFLFYTPRRINTKKSLIIFRCCSIIPIIYIFVSFFIYYADIIFGANMTNLWFKNFFIGQRLPLSILAIVYLVSVFFLRLYYKKKFGEENANRYFMGNRFIFKKNIMTAIIVIIIWIFEMIFSHNTVLNKMGIGLNEFLIIILPFILFYHPHKGPRNKVLDYLILFLFIGTMLYGYIMAAFIVLVGLL